MAVNKKAVKTEGEAAITTSRAKDASLDELMQELKSSETGLSQQDAERRFQEYGPNEIIEKKPNPILKFLSYFWGPIPWMVEVAVVLSAVIRHWPDFFIIFTLLLINAMVGFWQEYKAGNAIELLKKRLAPDARVLRDGQWMNLPARQLVPGDVVRVRLGDIVPADLKLIHGDYLSIDESALTGESLPVERHAGDLAYSSSIIRQGEMNGLVVATAMNTFFGRTAQLVGEAKTRSHFQSAVMRIGDFLIITAAVLIGITFIVAIFRHNPFLEQLQFALVLTIAAIPVALPAVLTVTMAVGAIALAKKEAIVSKLTAIEEMAGVDILCSDKTGTITKNQIEVADIQPFKGFDESDVLLIGVLASRGENHDPIDDAIIARSQEVPGLSDKLSSHHILEYKPFDPVIKRAEARVSGNGSGTFRVVKGAPQVILDLVAGESGQAIRKMVERHVEEYADKGYRALGMARCDEGGTWEYVGVIALNDPPREDSAETISMAKKMGLDVKMVTGDHVAIARQIAGRVNLGTNIQPASAFINTPDDEATEIVEKADGFAQVFPEDKYRMVDLLQKKDHIVGMTGDGVNDAPALKKADAGIAVAGATDAARSAADIVLTLPGLSVIIDAIEQSRMIFRRMTSYAIYRIAETIRVLFFITLAILIFNFYPLTAVMIVLLALLNDIPIMMIAYDNAELDMSPERWDMREVISIAAALGFIGVAFSFGLYLLARLVFHIDPQTTQTLIFLKLAVSGHLTIYLTRTGRNHFWSSPYPSWRLLVATETTQVVATFFAAYGIFMHPLGWTKALLIWAYAMVALLITDQLKVIIFREIRAKPESEESPVPDYTN